MYKKLHYIFQLSKDNKPRTFLLPTTTQQEADNVVHHIMKNSWGNLVFNFGQWVIMNPLHEKDKRRDRIQYLVKRKKWNSFTLELFF